ncbi:MAG: outer membrane beta-barrel family protein [Paramuribaculum sp.]|nr:outer membrane beta-barrel family protein [Paramuribaculum sp.]
MRPIRLLHTFIACIIASMLANAQSHSSLQFRIIDDADEPVAYAVVVAVNEQDSITSAPAFSSETGDVSLALDDAAAYTALKVQCMGYVTATIPLPLASSTIVLAKDPNMLGEVVVKAGPAMTQREGKFLFNPVELYSRTPDAYSLLRLTPLLDVSDNGVLILGKSAKIHINGRDPKMDPEAVMAMLQSLPPGRIKKIEIDPVAGADQSMSGGIVNVVIENPQEGYFGNASARINYDKKRLSPTITSFNAYTIGKFRSSALLTYQNTNTHTLGVMEFDFGEQNRKISETFDSKSHAEIYRANLNFAYDFSKSSVLGFAVSLVGSMARANSLTESTETFSGISPSLSSTAILKKVPWQAPGYRINASYTLNMNDGGIFDVEAEYTNSEEKRTRDNYYDSNPPVQQWTDWSYSGFHLKPTYRRKFNDVHTINVGYDVTRYITDNDNREPDADNHFIYTEMINSAFVIWSATWSNVFFTRLGARLENTDINTHQLVGDIRSSSNYTDVNPSIKAGINLPYRGNQSFMLDISRRIFRPYYNRLNSFKLWSTPYSYSVGNPNLKPTTLWQFGLNYSFLGEFNFNIAMDIEENTSDNYIYTDEDDNVVSSYANFGSRKTFRSSLTYYKAVNDIWYVNAHASIHHISYNATLNGNDLGFNDWMYSLSLSNNLTLSRRHKCFLNLMYNYSSPVKSISGTYHSMHWCVLDITKQFNNGLSLSASASALLGYHNINRLSTSEFSFYRKDNYFPITANITVKYTFGNSKVKRADNRKYDSPLNTRLQ